MRFLDSTVSNLTRWADPTGPPVPTYQGAAGHGRTKRPDLPVVYDEIDLADAAKRCPSCGLPHLPNPALDEHSDVIEVEVKAYVRRIRRPAYTRHPGCTCEDTPAIITAPLPPRLIPRRDYGMSYWVEVILSKYRYAQPSSRHLQDLKDQGLPVSPGTLAGGLQAIAPQFKPVLEALYCKPLPGAQLRYLVYSSNQPVALLGFGAAAWMCAPRGHCDRNRLSC